MWVFFVVVFVCVCGGSSFSSSFFMFVGGVFCDVLEVIVVYFSVFVFVGFLFFVLLFFVC